MADVITRFKLETTQFDSKLRDSSKAIRDIAHQAELGGKGFKDFSQKSIEAARSLGQVASGATNTKDKVKDLVGAYNEAAKAYNSLTKEQQQSDFGKALANSIGQLSERIKEAKQELYSLGDAADKVKKGGLFGEGGLTGMMAVAGGNLIASGITKLGSEIADTVQQSIELAKHGEGIRMAFERLNQPGLLNNLKEATHGTVSEIDLMKQAIQFSNFKLPLEDLSTYLAFAQQKAKDTGQSIDDMVSSIVTGLGRQSIQILDNLGISATEIRNRMKEGGDMTQVVADIIREEMAKAGEYVETAADRAALAAATASDRMEALGRKAMPVAEEWANTWNTIKFGALDLLNSAITPLINSLTEAGRLQAALQERGSAGRIGQQINWLKNPGSEGRNAVYERITDSYVDEINHARTEYNKLRKDAIWNPFAAWKADKALADLRVLKQEYQDFKNQAKAIMNPSSNTALASATTAPIVSTIAKTTKGGRSTSNLPSMGDFDKALGKSLLDTDKLKEGKEMLSPYQLMLPEIEKNILKIKDADLGGELAKLGDKKVADEIAAITTRMEQQQKATELAAQAAQNFGAALAGLDDPAMKAAGTVMQAIANIALSFSMAATQASTLGPYGWIAYMAAGAGALATTISTIHSLTGYAEGGMVKGNSYSGDNIFAGNAMVNAGELVLNKAQQATLAQNLQGEGRSINVQGILSGENILIATERTLKRKGRGELVTWK